MDELLSRMNAIYAILDDLATDGDPAAPHTLEVARRRDETRAAIDQLVARGLDQDTAHLATADGQLADLLADIQKQTGRDAKITSALDAGAKVIQLAAQIAAQIL